MVDERGAGLAGARRPGRRTPPSWPRRAHQVGALTSFLPPGKAARTVRISKQHSKPRGVTTDHARLPRAVPTSAGSSGLFRTPATPPARVAKADFAAAAYPSMAARASVALRTSLAPYFQARRPGGVATGGRPAGRALPRSSKELCDMTERTGAFRACRSAARGRRPTIAGGHLAIRRARVAAAGPRSRPRSGPC
ncbi:hypothetical protein ACRAWD_27560 [Caulobacter segnis]